MTSTESAPRRGGMVRNFVHLGLGQVATTLLTILLSATLARWLGPSDFGLLFLVMSIAGFAYVVIDWGHGNYIIRETARNPEKAGELMGSAIAVRTVVALLACPVAFATTWLLGYDMHTRVLTTVLILCWLPQYLGLSFGWVFRAHERMDLDAVLNVILKLATLVASVACLALGGHVLAVVATWSAAGCLTLAVGLLMYRRLLLPSLSASLITVRDLLRGGAPIFAVSLAGASELFLNANILYKLASPEVVGWFGVAWSIAGTLVAPASILGAAMYPRLSKSAGNRVEFKQAFEIAFRPLLLLAVLGAVGTYLFAEVPVALIYSMEKFSPAADILRAFAPTLLLMYIDMLLGMAALAAGKSVKLAIAKMASVVLTTGLVFILVPVCQARLGNGGLGVMYALIIGELVMFAASGILIRDAFDSRTLGSASRTLLAGAITILIFRLLPALTPFLAIPLCIAAFAGLALLVGAVKKSDIETMLASFRKRSPA